MTTPSVRPMSVVTTGLCIAAALLLAPLWAPIVLAAWLADLLLPAVRKLERAFGGRRRAAGVLVVLVVVGVLLPIVGIALALATAMQELLAQVRAASEGQGSLAHILIGSGVGSRLAAHDFADLGGRYGANAWRTFSVVARASASAAIAALVFVAAVYTFAVDGERAYAWLEKHAPIPREELARLAGAFRETGRGLLVAGVGTALVQGALATVAYVAIGIPRALILGPLTAVCALVPFVGTALVWIPLAIELAASGQVWRAGAIVVAGAGVSTVDNFVRPVLARSGHLRLPTFVVLISMVGGIAAVGATGALLGPLVVRLCVESLAILADRRRRSSLSRDQRDRQAKPVDGAEGTAAIARSSKA